MRHAPPSTLPVVLGFALLALHAIGHVGRARAGAIPDDPAAARRLPDVIAPLIGSVVNIAVLKPPGSDPTDPSDQVVPDLALGSGFVISPDGYVMTNKHVVEGGYDVTVAFQDGETFPARISPPTRGLIWPS